MILGDGSLTSFADTSLFLSNKKVATVTSWEAVSSPIEAWGMLCHIFLVDAALHPATYEVCSLLEETNYVGAQMQA